MAIEDPVNNTAEKYGFKSLNNEKDNNSDVWLFTKPVATCHKCGKKSHMERDFKLLKNGCGGDLSHRSSMKLPKWVTKNHVISDVEYLTTDTMNRNNNQYTWSISFNNSNGSWVYQWKVGHKECK